MNAVKLKVAYIQDTLCRLSNLAEEKPEEKTKPGDKWRHSIRSLQQV